MNRREEYWALIETMSQEPPALAGSVSRAVRRAKARRWRRPLGVLGSLAGICAAFVLMVNASPAFAASCGNIPVLKEIAAAVAWSPSLRAAIEHDYVQYVGQSQTVDGVTVALEYLIADPQQMVVFYKLEGVDRDFFLSCDLKDADGNELEGYSSSNSYSQEQLQRFTLHFTDLTPPECLVLELTLVEWAPSGDPSWTSPRFSFPVRLDPAKSVQSIILPVEQWVELDGQRLLVDRLELTPTRTALYLDDDPSNTAWLYGLDFYFTDRTGQRYDQVDGILSATGREDTPGSYTYFHQSLYFADFQRGLTLHITGATWLDKDATSAHVDLTTGGAAGLPDGMTVDSIERNGNNVDLRFASSLNCDPFSSSYFDPEGGEHSFRSSTMNGAWTDGDGVYHLYHWIYLLENYPWQSVELKPWYTHITRLDSPLSVPIS